MFITLLIIVAMSYALGWRPDYQAIWTGIVSGVHDISFAPASDWRAMLRRIVGAVGILLLVVAVWTMWDSPTTNGTYADLHQAIVDYQTSHGLTPDGVWGPRTNTVYLKGN